MNYKKKHHVIRPTSHVPLVILGPDGSFSSIAAKKLRGTYKLRYVSSFKKLFSKVSGAAYGLVPVRNKIIGKLPEVFHLFKKHRCKILHRFRLPISFVLAAKQKIKFADIKKIFISRPAYEQCKKFLRTCLPQAHVNKNFLSTSYAFKKVVQRKGINAAVIGNAYAAKLYNLKILARNIQDSAKDWTEFIIIK